MQRPGTISREMKSPLHPARAFLSRFGRMHIIIPVSFLNASAYTIVSLGLIFYLRDRLGVSAGIVGLASALFNALYFAGCFVLRPIGLRILPRYSLILSSFISSVLLGLMVMASEVWLVLTLYAFGGFALSLFWPSLMGWLSAGVEGRTLSRRISYFNMAWSMGAIVGPLAAGFLAERRLDLPLIVGSALILIVGFVVLGASIFLSAVRTDTHRDRRVSVADGPDHSTPLRYPSWIGLVSAYAVLGALVVTVPLHARDQLALTESSVGMVLLLRTLAASAGFWLFGRWSGWHFRISLIVIAPMLLIPLLLVLRNGSLVSYVAVLPLIGLTVSGIYTFSVFHGVAGTSDRTRRMAIHEALLTLGIVIGSLGAGRLYEIGGAQAAYLGGIAMVAVGVVVQLVAVAVRRSTRSADVRSSSEDRAGL